MNKISKACVRFGLPKMAMKFDCFSCSFVYCDFKQTLGQYSALIVINVKGFQFY